MRVQLTTSSTPNMPRSRSDHLPASVSLLPPALPPVAHVRLRRPAEEIHRSDLVSVCWTRIVLHAADL
ncbi:unnamed protein product [Urochloa humidicola]